jgi:hypothetical protein
LCALQIRLIRGTTLLTLHRIDRLRRSGIFRIEADWALLGSGSNEFQGVRYSFWGE